MASKSLDTRKTRTAMIAAAMSLGMLGMGFAAVPLYRLFCQVTGFGGTTQRASADEAASAASRATGHHISVRFDGNVDGDLPWSFRPEQATDDVVIGERDMAIFLAKNNSNERITGTASYNVEPEQAGAYFNKIQCFCFTEQTLDPGQEVRMPVLYYVDPKALDDPNMKGVEQITLSYTFHRTKDSAE
jgi:cytochrome c oxidase assembly protein subunit 11